MRSYEIGNHTYTYPILAHVHWHFLAAAHPRRYSFSSSTTIPPLLRLGNFGQGNCCTRTFVSSENTTILVRQSYRCSRGLVTSDNCCTVQVLLSGSWDVFALHRSWWGWCELRAIRIFFVAFDKPSSRIFFDRFADPDYLISQVRGSGFFDLPGLRIQIR